MQMIMLHASHVRKIFPNAIIFFFLGKFLHFYGNEFFPFLLRHLRFFLEMSFGYNHFMMFGDTIIRKDIF